MHRNSFLHQKGVRVLLYPDLNQRWQSKN
jgi:hypothetical protein